MKSFMKPCTDWMLFNSFHTISSIVKIYWPYKSCTLSSDIRSHAYRNSCLKVVKDADYCQNIFTAWRRCWLYYIDRKYVLLKDLKNIFFPVALQSNVGQGLPNLEGSRSHKTSHHSQWDTPGRVISSLQRPLPDNTQQLQETNIHASGGIRTHNLSRRTAADLRLWLRGHRDRL